MDETAFQDEIRELKLQIHFMEQIADLKSSVASIKEELKSIKWILGFAASIGPAVISVILVILK